LNIVFDELNFESTRPVTKIPVQIPAEINKPDNDVKSAKLIGNKHKNNLSPDNTSEAGPSSSKLRRIKYCRMLRKEKTYISLFLWCSDMLFDKRYKIIMMINESRKASAQRK
ncbi:hypothetical protein HW555_011339, partial [Spodoptera exigua]